MMLVRDHPDWTDSKIATEVGRNPSQLSRNETYRLAAAMARGDKRGRPAGFVKFDPESGQRDVDGFSEDSCETDRDDR